MIKQVINEFFIIVTANDNYPCFVQIFLAQRLVSRLIEFCRIYQNVYILRWGLTEEFQTHFLSLIEQFTTQHIQLLLFRRKLFQLSGHFRKVIRRYTINTDKHRTFLTIIELQQFNNLLEHNLKLIFRKVRIWFQHQ